MDSTRSNTSPPTLSDSLAALELIGFLAQLGDEIQADRMARDVHPQALANKFIFALSGKGDVVFITPWHGISREDNGAFEYLQVLSPVAHILPPGMAAMSNDGLWSAKGYASGIELAGHLLDIGFFWSESAQLHFDEHIGYGPAPGAMHALLEARSLAKVTPHALATAQPRL